MLISMPDARGRSIGRIALKSSPVVGAVVCATWTDVRANHTGRCVQDVLFAPGKYMRFGVCPVGVKKGSVPYLTCV